MKIKRDKLDILFAQYIKLRDKVCQRCGGTSGLQTAHFYGRARKSVRFDGCNSTLLCFGCHQFFHSRPAEFVEWYRQRLGDKYDLLQARMRDTTKIDRQAIELYLKAEIKKLEEG